MTTLPARKKSRRLRALALGALVAMGGSWTAAAAGPTANHNNTVDRVRGVGSDTTYFAVQRLMDLYNPSPGCNLNAATGFTNCTADGTIQTENHDKDEVSQGWLIGSSNGVKSLCGGIGGVGPSPLPIDFARSSRDKAASDCGGLTFKAFAKDGQIPLFFPTIGARPADFSPRNLTKAQLQGIFLQPCSINNWSQLGGANAPIIPWGVQTGAGTYASWQTFLGGDPNGCAGGISAANRAPFIIQENDAGPIAAAGTDVQSRSITWFSYGRFLSFPFAAQNGKATSIDGISASPGRIADGTFPAARNLWNAYKTATVSQATKTFLTWSCNETHAVDPSTGKNYNLAISQAINNGSGFSRLTGGGCVEQTT